MQRSFIRMHRCVWPLLYWTNCCRLKVFQCVSVCVHTCQCVFRSCMRVNTWMFAHVQLSARESDRCDTDVSLSVNVSHSQNRFTVLRASFTLHPPPAQLQTGDRHSQRWAGEHLFGKDQEWSWWRVRETSETRRSTSVTDLKRLNVKHCVDVMNQNGRI